MHPVRKQRLLVVLAIVGFVSLATGLFFYAFSDNLNLFYTPTQIKNGEAPIGQRIRAGGMVLQGSVERVGDSLTTAFSVTDYESILNVIYTGILPNLFAENDGVVVAGKLHPDGLFKATEVLAKHDENYMPPEVRDTLKTKPNPAETTYNKADTDAARTL